MGRVAGKVAVVTGAASGLGLASSRLLAQEGATVIMADVNAEQGHALANEIEGAEFHALDVTKEQAWIDLFETVNRSCGRVDILLNCAGIVRLASIEQTTEDDWRAVHAVGTDGTFYGCKHVLPVMKAQGAGSIINMCSTASIQGAPGVFAYAASKAAIRAMTKSIACLSTENGYGLRCNSIHPYNMATPMLEGVQEQVRRGNPEAAAGMDQVWVGEADDVANMVLFLASEESKAVNGAALVIDNTATVTQAAVMKQV
ncbi:SDR family oxidoreductase [Candidatus Marimicrobium litorale]|uniref:SDR family oxidoreductase n=1 Tax=Candidatus Marimicrobium litorale TaxID=2518991 RepID=A0ABT3T4J7_9GAMM|nr:SDR family oxidoreductase [Candidatus Marimicrobium litorale]MCX2976726.1 SDR family oxidoreductase [Candidatus Marimicrobium litorale]